MFTRWKYLGHNLATKVHPNHSTTPYTTLQNATAVGTARSFHIGRSSV